MTFQRNPLNDDLVALKNATAISRSVKNIVFTQPGEKFFDEDFGSRVSRFLFENIDPVTASNIKDEIVQSILNTNTSERFWNNERNYICPVSSVIEKLYG